MDRYRVINEILERELHELKEFLKTLKNERDSIISFSLEGIVRENNKKEQILKKLEYIEKEKANLLSNIPEDDPFFKTDRWMFLVKEIRHTMEGINDAMNKNIKLLSFSMDHVRSSIENIVGFINKATYGREKRNLSIFAPRKI
ncbi:MAG: flagellar protein FlgN [Syntrophorhabdaceae bacterium]|nr:flagellar protein FlgN [Syntrophorhabdaceae bacterium]